MKFQGLDHEVLVERGQESLRGENLTAKILYTTLSSSFAMRRRKEIIYEQFERNVGEKNFH